MLDPSALSPHSVNDTRSLMMQQQQQMAAQAQFIEYNQAGDRPGFLPGTSRCRTYIFPGVINYGGEISAAHAR